MESLLQTKYIITGLTSPYGYVIIILITQLYRLKEEALDMPNNITICADADIIDAVESCLKSTFPSFTIGHKGGSYLDCLEPSIKNKANIFILHAKPPITFVDDMLFALQFAGVSPVYVLFQMIAPGVIRFATTTDTNPLAEKVDEIFRTAFMINTIN